MSAHESYKSYCFAKEVEINPLIEDCQGVGAIQVSLREEIDKQLFSLDAKIRRELTNLHVKCIKVQLKSRFSTDIDCPIRIGFIDRRLTSPSDALQGAIEANLGLGAFTVCYKPGFVSYLHDRSLDSTYTIGYQIFRGEFMKKENSPFSISYTVEYAVTASHHAFPYNSKPSIEVDDDIYSKYAEVRRKEDIEISHIPKIWTDPTEVDYAN